MQHTLAKKRLIKESYISHFWKGRRHSHSPIGVENVYCSRVGKPGFSFKCAHEHRCFPSISLRYAAKKKKANNSCDRKTCYMVNLSCRIFLKHYFRKGTHAFYYFFFFCRLHLIQKNWWSWVYCGAGVLKRIPFVRIVSRSVEETSI